MGALARASLPVSICRGPLRFGDVTLDAHVLDDATRVVSKRTVVAALTGGRESGNLDQYIDRIPNKPNDSALGTAIEFRIPTTPTLGHGISADGFVAIVKAYAEAYLSRSLHPKAVHIGERCTRIMVALAGVAITALIDEATGYRQRNYADEIERKIATYLLPAGATAEWERTFPPEFFDLACKLYRIPRNGKKNPGFIQGFIRTFVYDFLDADVAREVKKRNPDPRFGSNHHQHYADRSRALLGAHITKLLTVMRQSSDRSDFAMRFACEFKGGGLQLSLPQKGQA